MAHALVLHPDCACAAITGIDVDILTPHPGALVLRFVLRGDIGLVLLPPHALSERTDGLWQHTCVETFVRPGAGASYYEFNIAPSTQWAGYRFTGYRDGMSPAAHIPAPYLTVSPSGERLEMLVSLDLSALPREAPWRLGLSAVIEETNGNKSYWALAHPPGKPDFHHADCFALELPAAERA